MPWWLGQGTGRLSCGGRCPEPGGLRRLDGGGALARDLIGAPPCGEWCVLPRPCLKEPKNLPGCQRAQEGQLEGGLGSVRPEVV